MPKDRVRANNPALPSVTRRAALAAPLVLLPSNSFARSEIQPLQHRILSTSEKLLQLVNTVAPEQNPCFYCAAKAFRGRITFDARLADGAVLDPHSLQWI